MTAVFSLVFLVGISMTSYSQICPFAKPDFDSTIIGTSLIINIGANDSVGPNAPSISIVVAPSHGSVVIISGDSVRYTPAPGYLGNDFFIYTVCDTAPGGCGCATSQVVIKVTNPPCLKPFAEDDSFFVLNNASYTFNLILNDSSRFFPLNASSVFGGPFHGTLTPTIDFRLYLYQADSGYVGSDTIFYRSCNSCGECDSATVYISISEPCIPPIALTDRFSVEFDSTVLMDVTSNDTIGSAPFFSVRELIAPSHGVLTSIGTLFSYKADSGYVGVDSFGYTICSTCACDTAWVFIQALEPCKPPLAINDIGATGYSPSCGRFFGLTLNDIGTNLNLTIVSGPRHGSFVLAPTGITYFSDSTIFGAYDTIQYAITNVCGSDTGVLYVFVNSLFACNGVHPNTRDDFATICRNDSAIIRPLRNDFDPDGSAIYLDTITVPPFNGTIVFVNDSTLKYVPNPGYFGIETIYYQTCDSGIPNLCTIGKIEIDVKPCLSNPIIVDALGNSLDTVSISILEDGDTVICFSYFDADSDAVTISGILGAWSQGNVLIGDTCVTLQTLLNRNGLDTFRVFMCDADTLCDTVLVIINVIPVNDKPNAVPDTVLVLGSQILVNPTANDTDADSDNLSTSFILNLNPTAGTATLDSTGRVLFTPDSMFAGIDTVVYIVCDPFGLCDTSAMVFIVPVNARNDEYTTVRDSAININITSNDAVSPNTIISLCGGPSNGSVIFTGLTATYTPSLGFTGNDQFCYVICDTLVGVCDTATVTITVNTKDTVVIAQLNIPQGFSPNGDNINDFFNIQGIENYSNAEVIIFNRWGDEVWRSGEGGYKNTPSGAFSGLNKKDDSLPDGTYFYVLKFNSTNLQNQSGFIEMRR